MKTSHSINKQNRISCPKAVRPENLLPSLVQALDVHSTDVFFSLQNNPNNYTELVVAFKSMAI